MWGEILEEENYDPNEEFYDHEQAERERKRRNQMEAKKKRADGKKLKRKVIYVYEDEDEEAGGGQEYSIAELKSASVPPTQGRHNGVLLQNGIRSSRVDYGDE